jgi:hypothetical protein
LHFKIRAPCLWGFLQSRLELLSQLEEKTHVGEFQTLLLEEDKEQECVKE